MRAYVLKHRDDLEAILTLFHHPHLKENIKVAEATLKQRIEHENLYKEFTQLLSTALIYK
ncbi:DUF6887 family protein [Gloeocapsopsis crepidinum]|uniref:DUF6887 family protein n=1 Tax=Gloeocapsopsis crepidinum TaxID=693223 RepID=UPI00389903DA